MAHDKLLKSAQMLVPVFCILTWLNHYNVVRVPNGMSDKQAQGGMARRTRKYDQNKMEEMNTMDISHINI